MAQRFYVGEPLEGIGAALLICAAVALGVVFHRAALSVTLGLLVGAVTFVYFANVFQDVQVKYPKLFLKRKQQPAEQVLSTGVSWTCAVCDKDKSYRHDKCNEVLRESMRVASRR